MRVGNTRRLSSGVRRQHWTVFWETMLCRGELEGGRTEQNILSSTAPEWKPDVSRDK